MNGGSESRSMAGSAKDSQRWIADEESIQKELQIHRTAGYGTNLRSVTDALEAQRERNNLVVSYEKDVNKLPKDAREAVTDSYDTLRVISEKRLNCLEDIASIAGLEDILGKLSVEFATKASSLVASECNRQEFVPENAGDGIKSAAQNCILAVRDNWQWISKLVKCTDTHLKNSSEYHEFFHEVKENEAWMPVELKAAQNKVNLNESTVGSSKEGQRWLLDIKELLTLFLHWQGKLEKLFGRSKNIVPVNLRTKKLDYYRPIESLVPYKTSEIDVREGEELLLVDNSNTQSWLVRNHNSVESKVPSVICLIPGPDPDAMQAATRLRFQLLTEWTLSIKRVGKSLILFNILVLKDWNNDEIKKLQAIPKDKKKEIVRILEYTLEALRPHWEGYAGYKELERRVGKMKDILKKDGNPKDRDQDFERELLARLGSLEDLFKNYGTMWSQWEAYKIMVEASRHADNMLIVDKWQQLKFIDMDELRKLWQQSLEFGDGDNMDFESWLKRMMEMWSKKVSTDNRDGTYQLGDTGSLDSSSSVTTVRTVTTTEQTAEDVHGRLDDLDSQFNTAERRQQELLEQLEMKRKQEADLRDQEMREKSERERREREMREEEERLRRLREEEERLRLLEEEERLRLLEEEERLLRKKREDEERERSDYGVHEERTVTTKTMVREPAGIRTGQEYSMVEESYETAGMLGQGRNGFEEAELETTTQSSAAMETATTDQVTHASQEEKKTFVITGVLDPRTGEEVSMHQAVMLGIINSQEGTYVNPTTKYSVPIPQAMNEGHIKVEFTSTKKTQEKRRDVGLITIRTQRESRPYTVRFVIDAKTDDKLSIDDAIRRRILDQKNGIYYNTQTEEDMSLADALDSGLLIVEYDNSAAVADPEVVSKTYSIHGVVDQRRKAKVSFSDAIRSGLLNRETGSYYHNIDREYIYVGDAIKRGFIKASLVKDPNSLDIDPENRVVVETLETMKRKLLNPLKTVAAFKKAAGLLESEKPSLK